MMQVRHETQLIDCSNFLKTQAEHDEHLQSSELSANRLDSYTLRQPIGQLAAIDLIACSPVGSLLAAYLPESGHVSLIDCKAHMRRDRLPLKPSDSKFSKWSFTLKGMDFSPDGQRLAVGQTDCIIYIFKLSQATLQATSQNQSQQINEPVGGGVGSKATITGKFLCSSPITSLIWVDLGILFGTQDGKVKLISISSQQAAKSRSKNLANPVNVASLPSQQQQQTNTGSQARILPIFSSPNNSMPIRLAKCGPLVAISYLDSNVHLVWLKAGGSQAPESEPSNLLGVVVDPTRRNSIYSSSPSCSIEHSCPSNQLTFLQSQLICCAGSDGRLSLYSIRLDFISPSRKSSLINKQPASISCNLSQVIDLKEEIQAIEYSALNEVLAVATVSRLLFLKFEPESSTWHPQGPYIELSNALSLTSLRWLSDGSQLAVGTLRGSLELFQCSWNKESVGERLELFQISKNLLRITDKDRNLLATFKSQHDIKRVNLLDTGQNIIIWTSGSLLFARLPIPGHQLAGDQLLSSEITWPRDRSGLKFCFDYPGFVLIYGENSRQLYVIKLGSNSITFSVKLSSKITRNRLSVRQHPRSTVQQQQAIGQRQRSAGSSRRTSVAQLDSIEPNVETQALEVSQRERFAYSDEADRCVNIINLKCDCIREMTIKQADEQLTWLELSYTAKWIAMRVQHKLQIINIETRSDPLKLLDECEFANWLSESDILIAQSRSKVLVWFDLDDLKNSSEFDSRNCNPNSSAPICDLSLKPQGRSYPKITGLHGCCIEFSNKHKIELDPMKVKFVNLLNERKLSDAAELLDSNEMLSGSDSLKLWQKLAWLSVIGEHVDLNVGLKAFSRLGYKQSWLSFLSSCAQLNAEEREWRLALFQGQWDTFERLAEAEQIFTVYRRCYKWSRAIEYANKTQKFKQRDNLELELRDWLVQRARFKDAAQLQAKQGDLLGALELLFSNGSHCEAADLLVSSDLMKAQIDGHSLLTFAQKLEDALRKAGENLRLARLNELTLNKPEVAIDFYLKANHFATALSLAETRVPERIDTVKVSFGEHLLSKFRSGQLKRNRCLRSIELLREAGRLPDALEAALELEQYKRALELLQELAKQSETSADLIKEASLRIGNSLAASDEPHLAFPAYEMGQHYKQLIEVYIKLAQYEQAFKVSLEKINNSNRELSLSQFKDLAKSLASEGRVEDAERIQLNILRNPREAIELNRKLGRNEHMLDLVRQFEPDQLEIELLQLAREAELASDFSSAERLLLQVSQSEWTNVVRMYRMANRWEDAFRIAKANCESDRDPLLVQLAFWWAKWLANPFEARKLLLELQLFKPAIEFCCENRNFALALDWCTCSTDEEAQARQALEALRGEIVRRQASQLEQANKFEEAERLLISENQLEQAVRMHVDNERYAEAIKLIERQLARAEQQTGSKRSELIDLLNRSLIECANNISGSVSRPSSRDSIASSSGLISGSEKAATTKRLQSAQQMYLRAQRPDLVVKMYQERSMWQEAVQVAQRFAPQLLEEVERALDASLVGEMGSIFESGAEQQAFSGEGGVDLDRPTSASIEALILSGQVQTTRVQLIKLFDSLRPANLSVDLLTSRIDELRSLMELAMKRGSSFEQLANAKWWLRLIDSMDRVALEIDWPLESVLEVQMWLELRKLAQTALLAFRSLSNSRQSELERNSSRVLLEEALELRLLSTHFALLFGLLAAHPEAQPEAPMVNQRPQRRLRNLPTSGIEQSASETTTIKQPNVREASKLMAKLGWKVSESRKLLASLSLGLLSLARSRQLNLRQALYEAGLRLMLANRPDLSRLVWAQLIELPVGANNSQSSQQIEQVRLWMLESLMGDDEEAAIVDLKGTDLRLGLEFANQTSDRRLTSRPTCLVCALPAEAARTKEVKKFALHQDEWRHVTALARSARQPDRKRAAHLKETIEFMISLSGQQ